MKKENLPADKKEQAQFWQHLQNILIKYPGQTSVNISFSSQEKLQLAEKICITPALFSELTKVLRLESVFFGYKQRITEEVLEKVAGIENKQSYYN
jgi:hypothetical protein